MKESLKCCLGRLRSPPPQPRALALRDSASVCKLSAARGMYRWRLWAGLGARRAAVVGCAVSWAHGSDPARAAAGSVDGPAGPPTDLRLTLPSAAGEERFRAVAVDPSSAAALRFAVTPLPPESVASLTFQQQQLAATVLAGGTGATVIGGTRSKMVLAVPGTGLLTARMLEPGVLPPPDAIIYAVSAEGAAGAEEAPAAAENARAEAELPAEAEASAPALPAEPSRRQAPRSPARPAAGLLLDSADAAPAPSLQSAPPRQASSPRRCVRNPRPFLLLVYEYCRAVSAG